MSTGVRRASAAAAVPTTALTGRETATEAESLELQALQAEREGDDPRCIQLTERALQIRSRLAADLGEQLQGAAGTAHEGAVYQEYVVTCSELYNCAERLVVKCNGYGVECFKRSEYETAGPLLQYGLDLTAEDAYPLREDEDRRRHLRGVTLNNLGCMQRRQGHFREALQSLQASMDITGVESPVAYMNMSAILIQLRLGEEAANMAQRAVELLSSSPEDPSLLAVAYHNLAMALEPTDPARCLQAYQDAYNTACSTVGAAAPTTKSIHRNWQRYQQSHAQAAGRGGAAPVVPRRGFSVDSAADIFPHPFVCSNVPTRHPRSSPLAPISSAPAYQPRAPVGGRAPLGSRTSASATLPAGKSAPVGRASSPATGGYAASAVVAARPRPSSQQPLTATGGRSGGGGSQLRGTETMDRSGSYSAKQQQSSSFNTSVRGGRKISPIHQQQQQQQLQQRSQSNSRQQQQSQQQLTSRQQQQSQQQLTSRQQQQQQQQQQSYQSQQSQSQSASRQQRQQLTPRQQQQQSSHQSRQSQQQLPQQSQQQSQQHLHSGERSLPAPTRPSAAQERLRRFTDSRASQDCSVSAVGPYSATSYEGGRKGAAGSGGAGAAQRGGGRGSIASAAAQTFPSAGHRPKLSPLRSERQSPVRGRPQESAFLQTDPQSLAARKRAAAGGSSAGGSGPGAATYGGVSSSSGKAGAVPAQPRPLPPIRGAEEREAASAAGGSAGPRRADATSYAPALENARDVSQFEKRGGDLVGYITERLDMLLHDEEEHDRKYRRAVVIQSHYRGHLARRRLREARANRVRDERVRAIRRNIAARTIQQAYRSRMRSRRLRGGAHRYANRPVRGAEHTAAAKIQSVARGWLARRAYQQTLHDQRERVAAVTRLQRWARASLARAERTRRHREREATLAAAEESERRGYAATRIQSTWRGYKDTKERRAELALRRVERQEAEDRRQFVAARRIQCAWRSAQARVRYNALLSAHLARESQRRAYQQARNAAITLQAFARGIIARNRCAPELEAARHRAAQAINEGRRTHIAAVRIQRAFRALRARRQLAKMRILHARSLRGERNTVLVGLLQRVGRGFSERRALAAEAAAMWRAAAEYRRRLAELESHDAAVAARHVQAQLTRLLSREDDLRAELEMDEMKSRRQMQHKQREDAKEAQKAAEAAEATAAAAGIEELSSAPTNVSDEDDDDAVHWRRHSGQRSRPQRAPIDTPAEAQAVLEGFVRVVRAKRETAARRAAVEAHLSDLSAQEEADIADDASRVITRCLRGAAAAREVRRRSDAVAQYLSDMSSQEAGEAEAAAAEELVVRPVTPKEEEAAVPQKAHRQQREQRAEAAAEAATGAGKVLPGGRSSYMSDSATAPRVAETRPGTATSTAEGAEGAEVEYGSLEAALAAERAKRMAQKAEEERVKKQRDDLVAARQAYKLKQIGAATTTRELAPYSRPRLDPARFRRPYGVVATAGAAEGAAPPETTVPAGPSPRVLRERAAVALISRVYRGHQARRYARQVRAILADYTEARTEAERCDGPTVSYDRVAKISGRYPAPRRVPPRSTAAEKAAEKAQAEQREREAVAAATVTNFMRMAAAVGRRRTLAAAVAAYIVAAQEEDRAAEAAKPSPAPSSTTTATTVRSSPSEVPLEDRPKTAEEIEAERLALERLTVHESDLVELDDESARLETLVSQEREMCDEKGTPAPIDAPTVAEEASSTTVRSSPSEVPLEDRPKTAEEIEAERLALERLTVHESDLVELDDESSRLQALVSQERGISDGQVASAEAATLSPSPSTISATSTRSSSSEAAAGERPKTAEEIEAERAALERLTAGECTLTGIDDDCGRLAALVSAEERLHKAEAALEGFVRIVRAKRERTSRRQSVTASLEAQEAAEREEQAALTIFRFMSMAAAKRECARRHARVLTSLLERDAAEQQPSNGSTTPTESDAGRPSTAHLLEAECAVLGDLTAREEAVRQALEASEVEEERSLLAALEMKEEGVVLTQLELTEEDAVLKELAAHESVLLSQAEDAPSTPSSPATDAAADVPAEEAVEEAVAVELPVAGTPASPSAATEKGDEADDRVARCTAAVAVLEGFSKVITAKADVAERRARTLADTDHRVEEERAAAADSEEEEEAEEANVSAAGPEEEAEEANVSAAGPEEEAEEVNVSAAGPEEEAEEANVSAAGPEEEAEEANVSAAGPEEETEEANVSAAGPEEETEEANVSAAGPEEEAEEASGSAAAAADVDEDAAATRIQLFFRRVHARRELVALRAAQQQRLEAELMAEELLNDAATDIQRLYRGHLGRRLAAEEARRQGLFHRMLPAAHGADGSHSSSEGIGPNSAEGSTLAPSSSVASDAGAVEGQEESDLHATTDGLLEQDVASAFSPPTSASGTHRRTSDTSTAVVEEVRSSNLFISYDQDP